MSEEVIRKAYYDPETGFTGAQKLYKILMNQGHYNITLSQVQKFIKKQEIAQISKKNIGKLGSFVPPHPLFEFQIDLIYLENKHLNKASYGLVCIDTFSKVGDVELMKRKSAEETVKAMEQILKRMGIPKYIYCDEGTEFNNDEFKKLMDKHGIELIFTLRHATIVERLNRTLKEMLYKYLQSTNTKTITNVLPKILKNYNSSYHRIIGMAPNEVNSSNEDQVYKNILKHATRRNREKIVPGDKVRVQLKRKSFDKGYRPKYSKEIYTVDRVDGRYYILNGLDRKYLRAFIEKIGEVERNINPPDLEGTREAHLRSLANRPVSEEKLQQKEELEQQRSQNPVSARTRSRFIPAPDTNVIESVPAPRPKRVRRKPKRLTYT